MVKVEARVDRERERESSGAGSDMEPHMLFLEGEAFTALKFRT